MVMMVMVVVVVLMSALLRAELLPHVVGILPVRIVLCLDVVDLVAERIRVEVERGAVAAADVEGDVIGGEDLLHGVLRGGHELGGESELAVRAEDSERGDVAVALGRLLLHLREDVADDAAAVVLGDVEELGPGEDVVEVVFHLVVLREAEEVAGLHREDVVDRRLPYAHHGGYRLDGKDRRTQRRRIAEMENSIFFSLLTLSLMILLCVFPLF